VASKQAVKVLLVCDHKWRDLPALVVIKHHLTAMRHRVLIASAKEFEPLLSVFQPDSVVLNHFWDRRYRALALRLRQAGIGIVVLPTEGSGSTDLWGPMIFGEFTDYSLVDYQLCWNAEWANGIAQYSRLPREKLDVVGCPRFDFAVAPLVNTCMTRVELCQRLGLDPSRPVITFASNFAVAKLAYAGGREREFFEKQSWEIGFTQSVARLGYSTDQLIAVYKASLDKFMDAFCAAARAFPNCQFVYKPHPNNDVSYIEHRLNGSAPGNCSITAGCYIADVLRGSDVLINSNCTTSIEAWIQGVPVVDAQLEPDPITGRADIAACNWVASDTAEVIAGITRGLQTKEVDRALANARGAFIGRWFHVVDGQRCLTAANSLDGFLRLWGRRRKFYAVSHGGGVRHVGRSAARWLLGLPNGQKFAALVQGRKWEGSNGGVVDKVVTRGDVRAMERHLKPVLAS
jgi:surface carbohydrate biosynthesis protein